MSLLPARQTLPRAGALSALVTAAALSMLHALPMASFQVLPAPG